MPFQRARDLEHHDSGHATLRRWHLACALAVPLRGKSQGPLRGAGSSAGSPSAAGLAPGALQTETSPTPVLRDLMRGDGERQEGSSLRHSSSAARRVSMTWDRDEGEGLGRLNPTLGSFYGASGKKKKSHGVTQTLAIETK